MLGKSGALFHVKLALRSQKDNQNHEAVIYGLKVFNNISLQSDILLFIMGHQEMQIIDAVCDVIVQFKNESA